MATVAPRVKLEKVRDVQRSHISRFQIPQVTTADTSPVYSLDVGVREGRLQVVRIASVSGVDYTVSIRNIEGASLPTMNFTVHEILRVENIDDTGYSETNLGIVYSNDDEIEMPVNVDIIDIPHPTPVQYAKGELPLLYCQIFNNDSVANTGDIFIELVIESGD